LQVTVFSPELNRFSPVFSYFGQAVFMQKRPFLWAVEKQKLKDRSLRQLLQGSGVGAAEGCDLLIFA
jgi:hypothetical protein